MAYYVKVLKSYIVFEGRARRAEYWYFALVNFGIFVALSVVDAILGLGFLGSIYSLLTLLPTVAVGMRRMHDVGKSGWYLLIPIYSFILALTPGATGGNQYGADPKLQG